MTAGGAAGPAPPEPGRPPPYPGSPDAAGGGPRPDSAERLFSGHVIGLTVEQWGPNEREIVDHPGAVAVVPVDRDGNVVLVRQLREATRRWLLEIPAGGLKPGEEPLDCGRRELAEETGLVGGTWTAAMAFWTTPGFCRELMWLYYAEGVEPGRRWTEPDADEEIEIVRWPLAEVAARLTEIEDLKTLAGLLLYLRERGDASGGRSGAAGSLAPR